MGKYLFAADFRDEFLKKFSTPRTKEQFLVLDIRNHIEAMLESIRDCIDNTPGYPEVARRIGTSEDTLRSLLHRRNIPMDDLTMILIASELKIDIEVSPYTQGDLEDHMEILKREEKEIEDERRI